MFYVIGDPLLLGRALINGTKGGVDMDICSNSTRRMLKIGAKKDLTHHTVFSSGFSATDGKMRLSFSRAYSK